MDIVFKCPHCSNIIIVNEGDINCGIFRHAVYKNNMNPINPHETKEMCDKLVLENLVFGCAKPFRIIKENNAYQIEVCEYI